MPVIQKIIPNNVNYVRNSDILFIHLEPFTHFYGDEADDNFFVMRSEKDDRILGFQILDYSRHAPSKIQAFLLSEGYELDSMPK